MSMTYDIACKTCKETLWIGQGWPPIKKGEEDRRHIYTGMPDVMENLRKFLFKHEKHELVFCNDQLIDTVEYHSFDADPGECSCERCKP